VSKYTTAERGALVKNIVATLSIKRIPEAEIIRAIFDQANKTLSKSGLFRINLAHVRLDVKHKPYKIEEHNFNLLAATPTYFHQYLHHYRCRKDRH